jgi:hypothetical protein
MGRPSADVQTYSLVEGVQRAEAAGGRAPRAREAIGPVGCASVLADHGSRRGRPGIFGYWVLEKPGVINPSQTLTEFHADGTYVIHDTANGQSGTYEAINGNWSLTSNTSESPRRDSVPTWITADGQVSHEADDNGYIAQYNKDMEAAPVACRSHRAQLASDRPLCSLWLRAGR